MVHIFVVLDCDRNIRLCFSAFCVCVIFGFFSSFFPYPCVSLPVRIENSTFYHWWWTCKTVQHYSTDQIKFETDVVSTRHPKCKSPSTKMVPCILSRIYLSNLFSFQNVLLLQVGHFLLRRSSSMNELYLYYLFNQILWI